MSFSSFYKKTFYTSFPEREMKRPGKDVLKESLVFFVKYWFISIVIILFVLIIANIFNINLKNATSLKGEENAQLLYDVLFMLFIVPLIEEILFRLWFSFRRPHIFISLFVLIYFVLTKYVLPHNHDVCIGSFQSTYFEYPLLKTVISATLASSIFLINGTAIETFSKKYGRILILVSVYVFALLHLTNARCAWYIYPFIVCTCLPQFILGITISNLRLRIGFWAGFLFHFIYNSIITFAGDGGRIIEALKSL